MNSTPPNQKQIAEELRKLRALRPYGPWTRKTQAAINEAISELEIPFDDTSGEWADLPDNIRDLLEHTKRWVAEGNPDDAPSTGWKGLAK